MIGDNGGDAGDSYQFISQFGGFKLLSDHSSQGTFNDTIIEVTGNSSASTDKLV